MILFLHVIYFRIFGDQAVFHDKTRKQPRSPLSRTELNEEEITYRVEEFRKVFKLPSYAQWPFCSIEMLGFGRLNKEKPLYDRSRYGPPYVGNATLSLGNLKEKWPCFWRPLFENWRGESDATDPNFWAIFFYCPSPSGSESCKNYTTMIRTNEDDDEVYIPHINASLNMQLSRVNWTTTFKAKVLHKDNIVSSTAKRLSSGPMAVCVSIPYTTYDDEKALGNAALLFEWVRYYTKLGFKIIIYDRDGANRQAIYNSTYAKDIGVRFNPANSDNVVYNDYTIRGLLDPTKKGVKYDNTESFYDQDRNAAQDRKARFEGQGHDKTATFSQCRFEAKALFGIETVLIVDYDEFLYCPVVAASAHAQAAYLSQYIAYHRRMGVEQLILPQRLISNTTADIRGCVVDMVQSGQSIFNCYAPFEYYMGGHSVKAIHLKHACPLTGYHQACPGIEAPRAYDCICENRQVRQNPWRPFNRYLKGRECAIVHFSTQPQVYTKNKFKPIEVAMMRNTTNEIQLVANSKMAEMYGKVPGYTFGSPQWN